jgi:uncharacterized membrane protein YkoI
LDIILSMRYLGVGLFLTLGVAFGSNCVAKLSVEEASRQASQYVGRVYSVVLSKNKKGECYYRVRGTEGTAVIDANDGKLLRFYRKRD